MSVPIGHLGAWHGAEFRDKSDFSVDLTDRHLRDLEGALDHVRARQLSLEQVTRESFLLPSWSDVLSVITQEVCHGRGFVLIRGFPVHDYSLEDLEVVYWGVGTHIGRGESQSVMGDKVGHVVDTSEEDPNARAYRNKQELRLHTDLCDVIAMLSLNRAATGGVSRYVSGIACYNEILARSPSALEILKRGFHLYRVGEQGPGELPYTPHRVPIFSERDGYLSIRYIRAYIHAAATLREETLTPEEIKALDLLDEVAHSAELMLEIMLEPGELSLINNYTVMHARSAFENDRERGRGRQLLRLWLTLPQGRPVVPEINLFDAAGIAYQAGQRPSGEGELLKKLTSTDA